jgi:hypothetical protein
MRSRARSKRVAVPDNISHAGAARFYRKKSIEDLCRPRPCSRLASAAAPNAQTPAESADRSYRNVRLRTGACA